MLGRAGASLVIAGHAILLTRILAAGFGADVDTWLMLGTWDGVRAFGVYSPSRYQGSPLAEVSIGTLASVGGHWLAGLGSVALGALAVYSLYRLVAERIERQTDRVLLASVLVATPLFLVAATTSHDYVYGLAFFLAGWAAQERKLSSAFSVALLALATASRPTYLFVCLLIILFGRPVDRPLRKRIQCSAAYVVVVVLAFLPAYISAHASLSFIKADRPTGQGLRGVVARSLLKPTTVFGLLGSIVFVVMVVVVLRAARRGGETASGERWVLALAAITVALWVWLPAEPSYLLPLVAIMVVWLARPVVISGARPYLFALLCALASLAWVDPQLLKFSYAAYRPANCSLVEAVGASISVRVDSGVLLKYPDTERKALQCNEATRRAKAAQNAPVAP